MFKTPLSKKVVAPFLVFMVFLVVAGCSSSDERAQAHYDRGVEFASEDELVKAGLEFRNVLKLKNDHLKALYALGDVEERQGNIETAFKIYGSVAEQSPENVPARLKLSYIFLAANQIEAAQRYADEAFALDDGSSQVLVAKAAVELKSGNSVGARRFAGDALEVDPGSIDALSVLASERILASDPEGAISVLDGASDKSESDLGLQTLRLAALEAMNDQPGVEKLFGKLSDLFPNTPELTETWAKWYLSKGRTEDAERVVRQYAQDNPTEEAQLSLISFLVSQRGSEAAQSELKKIIAYNETQDVDPTIFRLSLGQLLFSSGEKPEAVELLKSVVADASDTKKRNDARLLLGGMLAQTGQWDQAEQLANEILAEDGKNADALRLRASIKLERNENASAVDDILVALNEAPDNARLRSMLARAYERNGSTALAEEQYAKALTLDSQSPEVGLPMVQFLLRHGKADNARRILEGIRERNPRNRQVLTVLAQLRLASQDWIGAQEISETLSRLDDDNTDGVADKIAAAALVGLNKRAESITLLEKSFEIAGKKQALLPDLIRGYVQAGRQDAAITHLESILEDEPANALAMVLLGSVYMSLEDTDAAEKTFQSAAEVDEGALGNTSLAQFYMATGKPEEAEKAIRAGLGKDDDSNALRLMLTTLLQQSERFDEAIAEFEEMFEKDPESTVVANDLASLLSERRGDEQSLERAFEIAQRFRNSEIPQYVDTLGWIYYLRGEYSSALPLLRSAAQKLPDVGLVQYHLGIVLAKAGQTDQAIETISSALDLGTLMTEADVENARATLDKLTKSVPATESN